MRLKDTRTWRWIAILLLLPMAGCTLGADLLSSTFLSQLGFDPSSMSGQNGVIIVVFNNTTNATATFFAFEADSSAIPGRNHATSPSKSIHPRRATKSSIAPSR